MPFTLMVVMSFWTQIGYDFDTNATLKNYAKIVDGDIYARLLLRSLWISALCTFATVIISYPMAYYVAFHVHRRKMIWIILMTLPYLDQLPAEDIYLENHSGLQRSDQLRLDRSGPD